ncbi:hypothetical protein AVEN_152019-1 [Araneus ventricosus]|uniref:Uncharacterized protein n=1 Tax=Araneus ventricosus TaxID=182803 RepID=A0A4Y2X6N7_ARAVE|nr:hypothetical protein AVEN_152019-1 [Araneus ventricosus]
MKNMKYSKKIIELNQYNDVGFQNGVQDDKAKMFFSIKWILLSSFIPYSSSPQPTALQGNSFEEQFLEYKGILKNDSPLGVSGRRRGRPCEAVLLH